MNLSHSLSTSNEETSSSFSGWDANPPSSTLPINNEKQQESIEQQSPSPTIDSRYPSDSCDISFTVNMTTTDTKSVVNSYQSTVPKFQPLSFNLARKLIAETSESEVSIQHELWTRNIVYQSKTGERKRLSSSYNNLST